MKYASLYLSILLGIALPVFSGSETAHIVIKRIDATYEEFLDAVGGYQAFVVATQKPSFKLDPQYTNLYHHVIQLSTQNIARTAKKCDLEAFYSPNSQNYSFEIQSVAQEIMLLCMNHKQPDLLRFMIKEKVIDPKKRCTVVQAVQDDGKTFGCFLTPYESLTNVKWQNDQATINELKKILSE